MEIEPDLTSVELDLIIEEIDEDHTGKINFERKQTYQIFKIIW